MVEDIKFSKEYYKNMIKQIGEYISNHAEDYLHDFDSSKLRELNIEISIKPCEIPTVSVKKDYFPTGVEL